MPAWQKSWWSVGTSGWISLVTSAAVGAVVGALVSSVVIPWLKAPPQEIGDLIAKEASEAELQHQSESDVEAYANLFADDAVIVNVQAPAPNNTWRRTAAIVDRFRHLQDGPGRVISVKHELLGDVKWLSDGTILAVTISSVELDTGGVREAHEGFEVWKFKKVQGHWKIASFRFNVGEGSAL